MAAPSISPTMSPRGAVLLGAMRRNLQLLSELDASAPDDVSAIITVLVAHLRSWKPQAAIAVPAPLDTGPVARVDSPTIQHSMLARRLGNDGAAYELGFADVAEGLIGVHLFDVTGDDALVYMTPEQIETLRADLALAKAKR